MLLWLQDTFERGGLFYKGLEEEAWRVKIYESFQAILSLFLCLL